MHQANGTGNAEAQVERVSPLTVSAGETLAGRPAETIPQSSSAAESTPVVAPSPLMPNWGGSAQLFNTTPRAESSENGRSHLDHMEGQDGAPEQRAAPLPESGEPSHGTERQMAEEKRENDEQVDSSSDKGKGKAVTIEEARDDGE